MDFSTFYFVFSVVVFILVFLIFVALSRWIFRVNVQIKLLEQISADLKTLVTLEKMRKH
jgi:hypothetical protein